ncbi:hypothetical protein Ancab_022655 [Ancistrocladus abbreviatus]
MAGSSIASQLQAIKSLVKADAEPLKRPFTRPSILFDPKEAADIDIETIHSIALSGVETLALVDERFINHKNDLFSHKSRELDRELMGIEENNRINLSINSYLRLLSGHLHLPSALKTLEYLIRRYKIHVYNMEELILCALPYHDTHVFVRIVQLIDLGNSRWKFLDGVKSSGAPPPRKVIVQQCICDMGVLEVLCNYVTPSKKYQPSIPVVNFCTAVVVEVLGSVSTVESDLVKRILPFVVSGLQFGGKGFPDYKAGALMVAGLLANRATLSPKIVKSFVGSIAELACVDAELSNDLQWSQMSIMALVNIVQLQPVETLHKKAVDILKGIRDLAGILSCLSRKFNIDRFLMVLLESFIDYSNSDDACKQALISIVETVPVGGLLPRVVPRLLFSCLRLWKNSNASDLSVSGNWAKQILGVLNKKYPHELRSAFHRFIEDKKVQLEGESSVFETLCRMLDRSMDSSVEISDSRIWFALEHPKAEIRRATLGTLDTSSILSSKAVISERLASIQEAILRRLHDDDLSVVQAAVSLHRLSELISSTQLFEALQNVLQRCTRILYVDDASDITLASDITISCLKHAVLQAQTQSNFAVEVATMIFPLLLVLPKTKRLNLEAQELAKEIKWPFYKNIISAAGPAKKTRQDWLSSVNMGLVSSLADGLSEYPGNLNWLVTCSHNSVLSRTLCHLILLHSLIKECVFVGHCYASLKDLFVFLKKEWEDHGYHVHLSGEELNSRILDGGCIDFLNQIRDTNLEQLNVKLLVGILWRFLKACILSMPANVSLDDDGEWMAALLEFYSFFARFNLKNVFREHLHYLLLNCRISPVSFLSKFIIEEVIFSEVQVESLNSLASLCSSSDENMASQLLAEFPSVLVPLSSVNLNVREAAMNYVEDLFTLCSRVKCAGRKNGNNESWSSFIDELLSLMAEQKKLILCDTNFLPSLLTSVLSSSSESLLLPNDIKQRFDKSTRENMLGFITRFTVKLPAYAKLRILSLIKNVGGAIFHVKDIEMLLSELLQRRHGFHFGFDRSCQGLSNIDVDILCLLLEICCMVPSADMRDVEGYILTALQLDGMASEDPAIVRPCVSVLVKLNDSVYSHLKAGGQELLLQELVLLYRSDNSDIQHAAGKTLLRINFTCSIISIMLDRVLGSESWSDGSSHRKKKKSVKQDIPGSICRGENPLCFLSSLLDILLLKKAIENRSSLVEPLFQLLQRFLSNKWVHVVNQDEWICASSGISQNMSSTFHYIQQTILLILDDIFCSLPSAVLVNDNALDKTYITLLVEFARSTTDQATRNHAFSLFTTVSKIVPNKVSVHVPDILTASCKSTITQSDSHSNRVFEDLITAVVPCWLLSANDSLALLQIFVNAMSGVAQHRRLAIVGHLLRTLGESRSLGSMLFLLFRSLVSRIISSSSHDQILNSDFIVSATQLEWEYVFAVQICEQYGCMIWVPSLVVLLKESEACDQDDELFLQLHFAMKVILDKLQNPELLFKLESGEDSERIQGILGELMERVVCCLQLIDSRRNKITLPTIMKKELKELVHAVLRCITKGMTPSTFFRGVTRLLGHRGKSVRKKAIQLLCEIVKDYGAVKQKNGREYLNSFWHRLDGSTLDSFGALCLEILQLVDGSSDDISLKLAAVSALEVLANRFPSSHNVFSTCLQSVVKGILSDDLAVASGCLRTTAALINVLGSRALPELPQIMKNILKKSKHGPSLLGANIGDADQSNQSTLNEGAMLATLLALEALIGKLGAFLSPYLQDIVELLVLHPDYISESKQKVQIKADAIRRLLSEKIPVRLALPPMVNVYPEAVKSGDSSVSIAFEMLANFVSRMDRTSVSSYHGELFDLFLLALDIRHQHVSSIKKINSVEKHVINAMIALTMKLTETMFKPLFIRTVDWAEPNMEESDETGGADIGRAISFYSLVNKLAENHRSLFVPYFKHLLEGCVHHLTDGDVNNVGHSRKKRKARLQSADSRTTERSDTVSVGRWHLRTLVLSSLHKCFLYDTSSLKFLDSSNFQVLLKPIVSQLVVEPPALLDDYPDIPSVKEVDDILVNCIGQMAVTAGSDLLWKPLNYEVLMQTRSESLRSRILGLRIIKYLVENLKEEYLVLLAETIPFLVELLEDVELPVKTLAQEILKDLESLSGENLRQYF